MYKDLFRGGARNFYDGTKERKERGKGKKRERGKKKERGKGKRYGK